MSFDFRACFVLQDAISPSALSGTLDSFGIAFEGSHSGLVHVPGRVRTEPSPPRDWAAFVAEANRPQPSAFARLAAEEFSLEFGFVTLLKANQFQGEPTPFLRAAWLEISDGDLVRMGYATEDRGTDSLHLLLALFKALGASSMAMGIETRPEQFLQFFSAELPLGEMDERICTAFEPGPENARQMLTNPARRELELERVRVVTGYFDGIGDYF